MKYFFVINATNRDHVARSLWNAVYEAPEGYVARITEPTRSLEQNALIHALLTEVGDLLGWKWAGQEVDITDLKTIFVAAYRKTQGQEVRFAVGIDGQPVILSHRTRDFSKRECSEFTEMVNCWMANNERK